MEINRAYIEKRHVSTDLKHKDYYTQYEWSRHDVFVFFFFYTVVLRRTKETIPLKAYIHARVFFFFIRSNDKIVHMYSLVRNILFNWSKNNYFLSLFLFLSFDVEWKKPIREYASKRKGNLYIIDDRDWLHKVEWLNVYDYHHYFVTQKIIRTARAQN